MRLDEILSTSMCAEAVRDDITVFVEHVNALDSGLENFWYDVRVGNERYHNYIFDGPQDVLDELNEYIEADLLDWHATDRHVDLSNCTCSTCRKDRLLYGLLPPDANFLDKLLHVLHNVRNSLRYHLLVVRATLKPWLARLRHREAVVCEACGLLFEPDSGYYEPGEYAYCSECCHW